MAGFLTTNKNTVQGRYAAGVILLVVAGVLWSLNGVLIKLVEDGGKGPPAVVIAFFRSLFAGLFLLPLAWGRFRTLRPAEAARAGSRSWQFPLRPAAWSCAIFFTLMTASFVKANTETEAGNAIILQYTSTFWIFALSPWILKESARRRDLVVLGLAMTGVVVIFIGEAPGDLAGLLYALSAGLFFGLLTMMIRRMRDADSAAITVLNNLGSALLLLPFAWALAGLSVSTRSLILLIILGVVQFGGPYYLYTLGLARVPAYQASLITMIEPVLVPVWTFLVIGEVVTAWTISGAAVILAAHVVFLLTTRRPPRSLQPEEEVSGPSPGLRRDMHLPGGTP